MMEFDWDEAQAPDVVGRILACRAWSFTSRSSIGSVGVGGRRDIYWVGAGPHEARCVRGGTGNVYCTGPYIGSQGVRPPVVQKGCHCGYWGLNRWEYLERHFGVPLSSRLSVSPATWSGPYVVGLVALWGRVVPGTYGWRAQYAQATAVSDLVIAQHLGIAHLTEFREDVLTPPLRPEPRRRMTWEDWNGETWREVDKTRDYQCPKCSTAELEVWHAKERAS